MKIIYVFLLVFLFLAVTTTAPGGVGYELVDNNKVFHVWNTVDDYYFNASSGMQWTNNYNEYWTHNVMCIGYYSGDQWNKIACADELSNFNKDIQTGSDYVNITLWKDLSWGQYDYRMALQYHLKENDKELTITPYIKNIGDTPITNTLGFAWKVNKIQINGDSNPDHNSIVLNQSRLSFEDDISKVFKNMTIKHTDCSQYGGNGTECVEYYDWYEYIPSYKLEGATSHNFINLRWNENLNYKVIVSNPKPSVTLFVNVGTLDIGQEKQTQIFWRDPAGSPYLLVHYKFDEVAGTTYAINSVNTSWYGNVSGDVYFGVGGIDGTAARFNHSFNTEGQIVNSSFVYRDTFSEETICMWVYPHDFCADDDNYCVLYMSDETGATGYERLNLLKDTNEIEWFLEGADYSAGTILGKETWHHVCIGWKENDYAYIWINGTQTSNSSFGLRSGNAGNRIHIGEKNDYPATNLAGNFTLDEFMIWDGLLTDLNVSNLYNSYTRPGLPPTEVTLISPPDDAINTSASVNFVCNVSGYGNLTNMTLFLNCSGEWELNETKDIRGYSNETIFSKTLQADGNYIWNCRATNSSENSTFAIANFTYITDSVYPTFANYTTNVTSPKPKDYLQMNVTVVDSNAQYSKFAWNITGTMINDSAIAVPASKVLDTIRYINESWEFVYICWQYWVNDSAGQVNSAEQQCFYISPVLYNCSAGEGLYSGIGTLNLSFWHSENNTQIGNDIEININFNVWFLSSYVWNYSFELRNHNNYSICVFPNSSSVTSDMMAEYTWGTSNFNYFFDNTIFNNITKNLKLYTSDGTTIVTFTVIDENAEGVENAYIKVQKYDVGTDTYKTVEVLRTDADGEAIANIILNTIWYRFIVEYNNIVYLTDGPLKMTATTRTFPINLITDFYDRFTIVRGITIINCTYTNRTPFNFKFQYNDPSNSILMGCLKVINRTTLGDAEVATTCVEQYSSTILIPIGNPVNYSGTFIGKCYVIFPDGETYPLDSYTISFGGAYVVYSKEGVWWGILIIVTLFMVGIWNPAAAIVFGTIGVVFTNAIGLFEMNMGWIIGLIIVAGLAIYRTRQ